YTSGSLAAIAAIGVSQKTLPRGTKGRPYSATLSAKGGKPPCHWRAFGLSPGLTVGATTGVLSGVPTAPGTFAVEVLVADSASPAAAVGAASYSLSIVP
ncbi:MAG TPA: putative Ig domain-containing protein, partial [Acidimicrobiales bacterium]|nr:putative Ig domain-containing protein [Acidimicrobiales bacterium]